MRAVLELIEGHDAFGHVTRPDQDGRVAGESAGVAGYADDERDLRGGELASLRVSAGAGRIHDNRLEAVELWRKQRALEKVSRLGRNRTQARRAPGGALQGAKRVRIEVDCVHRGSRREP